ncbi:transcriptional regulator [Planotetraspora thailandica]|uniref:Transcriptional regulator n=1 Tax=Planotetraspora thailandica TaxID=487172 RepID=A0A8J3UZG8_9ACTN|nr:IclR family transcriptional regulator [Planotetraspora thailandica]GII54452.1 transcriptional regulator [Planotetraspora thailandica]
MQSVLRSFRVLEAVAEQQPVGVAELARSLRLPTSSVQRILVTLREAGWIAPTEDVQTRWMLTSRALAVGRKSVHGRSLTDAAAVPMRQLRDATQETVHLSVPDRTERMVIIDRVESEQAVQTYVPVGQSSPIHATASGRSVLAALPDAVLEEVIARGLVPMTDRALADPDRLREKVAEVRADGYAVVIEENRRHIWAIAAAVLDTRRRPVAAVAVSVPTLRHDEQLHIRWGRLVAETAAEIGAALRH